MADETLEGKWARIDERTRIILENQTLFMKKVEDIQIDNMERIGNLQTSIQDMSVVLSTKMDEHEDRDDHKFMTRREGGIVATTVTFLATVLTIIGIFWK